MVDLLGTVIIEVFNFEGFQSIVVYTGEHIERRTLLYTSNKCDLYRDTSYACDMIAHPISFDFDPNSQAPS